MSTGRPPAADVASMRTNASPEPAGRWTGRATPVEVSLCAQAIASTDGSDVGTGALPGSALMTIGSPMNGLAATAEATFALNSPKVRCSDLESIRPNAAASQNAVAPPLPRITS